MSGLEVVGLVAAIISAYSGTASFLISRKKRKEEMEQLQKAVTLAPPQIQGEYD